MAETQHAAQCNEEFSHVLLCPACKPNNYRCKLFQQLMPHSGTNSPERVPCRKEERCRCPSYAESRAAFGGAVSTSHSNSKQRELPSAAHGQVLCCSSESLSFVIWVKPTTLLFWLLKKPLAGNTKMLIMEIMQIKQDLQIKSSSRTSVRNASAASFHLFFIQSRFESQAAILGSDARLREAGIPRGGVNLLQTSPFCLPLAAALQLLLFRITIEPMP